MRHCLSHSFLFALAGTLSAAECQATTSEKQICRVESQYASSNGTADDSPAITAAFEKCASGGIIAFDLGVDYNVLTPIKASNLCDVEIHMYGNLNLPRNVTYVQEIYNKTGGSSLTWFTFAGERVNYTSTANVTTGWIKSYGQAWWDLNAPNATGTAGRPHLSNWQVNDLSINHLKSLKPIAWNHRLQGNNIYVTNTVIEASSDNNQLWGVGFPFNTDGIQVSGQNVTILASTIYNGDDAFAISDGSQDVTIQRATVGYASHGMSIGSLGKDATAFVNVSNIYFDDITMIDTVYGARFKSWVGGQGLVKNVTWNNIRLYNVSFPVFVTQTYSDQSNDNSNVRQNNGSVNMEDFTWSEWVGTQASYDYGDGTCVSDPCWYDVGLPEDTRTDAIILECNTDSSCKNFQFNNFEVFPQNLKQTSVICINATAELNPNLGFDCRNGTYVPTA